MVMLVGAANQPGIDEIKALLPRESPAQPAADPWNAADGLARGHGSRRRVGWPPDDGRRRCDGPRLREKRRFRFEGRAARRHKRQRRRQRSITARTPPYQRVRRKRRERVQATGEPRRPNRSRALRLSRQYPTPRTVWINLCFLPMIDLVAQIIDVDVDDIGAAVEIKVPDMLGDHRARDGLSGVSHQIIQQRVFFRGQRDLPAPARGRGGGRDRA